MTNNDINLYNYMLLSALYLILITIMILVGIVLIY